MVAVAQAGRGGQHGEVAVLRQRGPVEGIGVGKGHQLHVVQLAQRLGHHGGGHAGFGHAVAHHVLARDQAHLGAGGRSLRRAGRAVVGGQAAAPAFGHDLAVGRVFLVRAWLARVGAGQRGQAVQARLDVRLRQLARGDGGGDGVQRFILRFGGAQCHDHVGAGGQRAHGGVADAIAAGDGVHVHAVGDDDALVCPLIAQQAGEDAARHGGRIVRVQRRVDDMRGHHGRRGAAGHAEGRQFQAVQFFHRLVHGRQVAVRVDVGVAVARGSA
ncbi:conserved hypothetical protein [Ricinus communis]|uniref:Uncharacterized protein n=1 Tax=Ricinus communis TaxID=3988 RepID=B9TA07_RICCO|nr:conserved hypothetical protein [Ricinus communis]